ncbi:MAG: ATP-binding protein [Cytophagaceae bacterium]
MSISLLVILTVFIIKINNDLQQSFSEVERTYKIINKLESVQNSISQSEASVRAFIINEEQYFINTYKQSSLNTEYLIKEIQKLVSDENVKEKILDLHELIIKKEQLLTEKLELSIKNEGKDVRLHHGAIEESRKLSEKIDFLLKDIKETEYLLLNQRREKKDNYFNNLVKALVIIGLSSLLTGILAFLALKKDIKERKRVEKDLRDINDNKNKFFTLISHDLKGPIRGIIALTEILHYNTNKNEEQNKKIVYHLHTSSLNLYKLVENLLNWSQIQMDRIDFQPVKFDFSVMVKDTIEQLQLLADEKCIEIKLDCPQDLYVLADRNMIITVLRNLINNAIKFTHEGGVIKISAKSSGSYAEIKVRDNGVGISEEGLKKIFIVGDNYSSSGTIGEKGTGLGLLICKEFIEKNKGTISADSIKGEGSVFTFTIPAVKSTKSSRESLIPYRQEFSRN